VKCEISVRCKCEQWGGWHSQTGRATLTVPISVLGLLRFSCPLPFPVPFLSFFPRTAAAPYPTLPDLTRPSSAFPTTTARRAYLSLLRAHGRACSSSSRHRHSFTGRLRILDHRSMCFDTFSTVVLSHASSPLCMRYYASPSLCLPLTRPPAQRSTGPIPDPDPRHALQQPSPSPVQYPRAKGPPDQPNGIVLRQPCLVNG
jgi:hypothetical protein